MSPLVAGILEIVDTPLYDTVAIPRPNPDNDLLPVELFRHPIGVMTRTFDGTSRVKSEIETNIFNHSSLAPPQKFLVRSIRAALLDQQGGLKGISSSYYRAAVLELVIGCKPYFRGPLYLVADPATMFLEGNPLANFFAEEREKLIRAMRHTFDEKERPMIETQEPFFVRVALDPAGKWDGSFAPGAIVVVLEGTLARAVQ